jgi:hypothetical protein
LAEAFGLDFVAAFTACFFAAGFMVGFFAVCLLADAACFAVACLAGAGACLTGEACEA